MLDTQQDRVDKAFTCDASKNEKKKRLLKKFDFELIDFFSFSHSLHVKLPG